jgi:limonene-1,2-epoxide hydrolase
VERSEAVAVIEERRDAWVNEDLETYLGLTAEDYVLEVNGQEELRGRVAFEDMIRRNYERFLPVSWDFHEIVSHGSHVLAEWTVTMEEKATGVRWSVMGMSVCEVRNGVLAWWREYRSPPAGSGRTDTLHTDSPL